ncbi:ExbD/TolR family protein [Collimonas pratensis]|uniref:Biopolymer transport ExbD/TolR family protein n=1 Tax=Collimonas pratensis TaxID=279113 RepID=A0A127R3E0_9BURK|nr:biopolymer transporter ExbD [Collimonas pratensis]AMP07129.1 biopolymer transport ExbD/TolR family protein [Collimonas pratensis]AMP16868.1 biopolymer transport ExbD/TolR family protein [Collimonas pratensis]NKI72012.1 biopolymer transporter ExbD [Collimonas pratensis]
MGMGSLSDSDDDFNPEINTTPLVDVMLVLLIIFIMTIPVMNHAVKIDLPRATNQPDQVKPESINLSIDADGKLFWNEEALDRNELTARIAAAAQKQPQPELHLRAARTVQYEKVAQVMAAAQSGGLGKIGFVTEPDAK